MIENTYLQGGAIVSGFKELYHHNKCESLGNCELLYLNGQSTGS